MLKLKLYMFVPIYNHIHKTLTKFSQTNENTLNT